MAEKTARLGKFINKISGSESVLKALSPEIDPSGRPKVLEDINVLVTRIGRILTTKRGTEFMDPDFGSDLYRYVFEPSDPITEMDIKNEAQKIAAQIAGNANIDVEVAFLGNRKGFRIDMVIEYLGQKKELTVRLDESLFDE